MPLDCVRLGLIPIHKGNEVPNAHWFQWHREIQSTSENMLLAVRLSVLLQVGDEYAIKIEKHH